MTSVEIVHASHPVVWVLCLPGFSVMVLPISVSGRPQLYITVFFSFSCHIISYVNKAMEDTTSVYKVPLNL